MSNVIRFLVGLLSVFIMFPFVLLFVALLLPVFVLFHLILITAVVLVSVLGFFVFIYYFFRWEIPKERTDYSASYSIKAGKRK